MWAQSRTTAFYNTEYNNAPNDVNIMSTSEYRQVIDLNGEWEIRIGESDKWQKIYVPSSLNIQKKLHFKKKFYLPADVEKYHAKLFVHGINYSCKIKLNGIFIGSHSGGYTCFSLDILESILEPGEDNIIEIEIDNGPESDVYTFLRPQPWGWKEYSGIVREIYLLLQPKITITSWKVDYSFNQTYERCSTVFTFTFQNFNQASKSSKTGNIELKQENIQEIGYFIEVYNIQTGKLVKGNKANPKFITVHQGFQDTLLFTFRNVALWSPENPILYRLKVTIIKRNNIIVDSFQTTFGFRDIEIRDNSLFLNGQKAKLIGIYRIEQHPDYGVSLPWEIQKQDIELMKNLGINVVRSGPYPNHPYFYELCDQVGLMVLEEIPVYQIPASIIDKQESINHALLHLQEMIERDRRHPSIVGWGLGSNLDVTDSRTAHYIANLASRARELDRRPIYYSSEIIRNDICEDLVDFKLLDFYDPKLSTLKYTITELEKINPESPIYIGRIGSSVLPENVDIGYTSLENQAKYVSDLYKLVENNDFINGIFFWSFADWQGSVPVLMQWPSSANHVYHRGLVTENRVPRPAYQKLKKVILSDQLTSFTIGNIPDESQAALIFTGFAIIIILLIALKQHRWFGKNFRRSLLFTKIFFDDILDRRNIQTWQTMMLGFAITSSFALGIASLCFFYRQDIYFDLVISQFFVPIGLKKVVVYLIWHPITNVIVMTLLLLCLVWIIALLHNLALMIFGLNRGVTFSLNLIIWSGSNLIFILPFSMAFYSALQHASALLVYMIIVIIFLLWYISRFLFALKITYDTFFRKALISIVSILIILLFGIGLFFQKKYQTFTYVDFYRKTINSQFK